jgi:hypothetical protein
MSSELSAEIKMVVKEAIEENKSDFVEGLKYGLILAHLWERPGIQAAWREATGEAG